jgi:hypothetical protein
LKGPFEWQLTFTDLLVSNPLDPTKLTSQLSELRRKKAQTSIAQVGIRLWMSSSASWKSADIPQFAANISKLTPYGVKLCLAALPDRLYEIASNLDGGRLGQGTAKKSEWSIQAVPPWSLDAIRFYLGDNNAVADDQQACQAIQYASCGFGRLIQTLCEGPITLERARSLKEYAHTHVAPNVDTFYSSIGMPTQIEPEKLRKMEDFMAHIDGEKRNDGAVEEYRREFGITHHQVQFLGWMGIMQEGEGNTWSIPPLYARLIS